MSAWREGMRRRRIGVRFHIKRIEDLNGLPPVLTIERATDIVSALVVDEICDVLVEHQGWSFDEYRSWVTAVIEEQILR